MLTSAACVRLPLGCLASQHNRAHSSSSPPALSCPLRARAQSIARRLYECTHGGLGTGQLGPGVTSELLVNVDSRGDGGAWDAVAAELAAGNFVTAVLSNNLHEVHGYNRLARMARGEVLIILQARSCIPHKPRHVKCECMNARRGEPPACAPPLAAHAGRRDAARVVLLGQVCPRGVPHTAEARRRRVRGITEPSPRYMIPYGRRDLRQTAARFLVVFIVQ